LGSVDFDTWKNDLATLIVASSDNVRVDFILDAIKSIMSRSDILVSLVVIGPISVEFEKAGINFKKLPFMSYKDFKIFIRTFNNPIGLIPLDESIFSSCKSPIKYIDYSFAGIPVICSNVLPYSAVIVDNDNGLLVTNDTFSWIHAIESLVQSVGTRKLIAKQALRLVENNYGLDRGINQWNELLDKLITVGFYNGKPHPKFIIHAKIGYIKFLFNQFYSLTAYRAAFNILRKDGIKALAARLIRGLL
jgi:glycosyltransferase involved in cell wall biosynthesis